MTAEWLDSTIEGVITSCDYGLSCGLSTDPAGVPILRMGNIQGGRVLLNDLKYAPTEKVQEQHLLHSGDLLLNRTNSIDLVGKVGLFREERRVTFASYLFRIRTDPARAVPGWLAQVLHSPTYQAMLRDIATPGVSQANINRDRLRALPLVVPSLGEQKKIAAILSSMDDAIETTQAVIDQLGIVKKAMMAELLTRGLPGRHKKFKMTEIGEVPEEWEVRTIDSVLESCTYGVNCPLSTDPASGTPVLRMTNIQGDRLDLSDLKYANLDALPRDKIDLRRGDLLFNRTNSADLVGKVALVDTDAKLSYASYLLRMRTEPTVASTTWLFYRLSAPDFQEQLRSLATKGVSQSNINPTKMRALLIAVPSTAEQSEIVAALGSVDERSVAELLRAQQLRSLKGALMSVLLTGEVRVKPDEEAA